MIISIDTHNCTREEKEELINYLEDNSWDYKNGLELRKNNEL